MARIGIDLDGCVYDFVGSLHEYLGCNKPEVKCTAHPYPTRWEFYEDWGYNEQEFLGLVQRGVDDRIVFRYGEPMPGSFEALNALSAAGHKIVFVTDRGGFGEAAVKSTEFWLEKHLPYVDHELHFTADKTSVPTDYFIDDRPKNIAALRTSTASKAVLLDRPWNRQSNLPRVVSWEDFTREILEVDGYAALAHSDEVRVTSATGGQKGQKTARLGSIDPQALMEMAKVAGFGEQKYARLNYLKGYDWSLSYDAAQRHFNAFWSGEDLDPESGLPHLAHAGWHCMAMLAFMIHDLGTDDRYRKDGVA